MMQRSLLAIAVAGLILSGCNKNESVPPPTPATSQTSPGAMDSGSPPPNSGATGSSTTPDTATDSPANATQSGSAEGMTPAQESQSMPQPGQANSHSSPALDQNKTNPQSSRY